MASQLCPGLYTGITTDLKRRVAVHNSGRGAKYTRSRLPVEPVYWENAADRSAAQRREWAIKAMSREEKCKLIRDGNAGGVEQER